MSEKPILAISFGFEISWISLMGIRLCDPIQPLCPLLHFFLFGLSLSSRNSTKCEEKSFTFAYEWIVRDERGGKRGVEWLLLLRRMFGRNSEF